jgi:hypothetical protein
MKVHFSRRPMRLALIAIMAGFILSSCTGHIGYGVMNWSFPEHGLVAGDIVPVFIQSNIGKVFVVGTGKGFRTRVEVPLWQLTLYKSKSKAKKAAEKMMEYRYSYATVKLDGLPIRAQPENTARQVYRLKEGQKLKVLKKGEGSPVLAGNSPLAGDWLEVMTDDGSTGWCFSYNLAVFDERDAAPAAASASAVGADEDLDLILSRAWYPDVYRTMIESGHIDIGKIDPKWGFYAGRDSSVARIESVDGTVTFPYSSIVRADAGLYRFEGSTLSVQVRRRDSILAQYTDDMGMPHSLYFVSLDTTPDALISAETERRTDILSAIRKAGPRFSSGNYGALQFPEVGHFTWSGYDLLSPAIIPADSGSSGIVDIRCFLSDSLAPVYDGVLSFKFDSSSAWIHFLYKVSPKGLKLEPVSESNIKDSVVLTQNLTPTVVFFTPDTAGRGGQ